MPFCMDYWIPPLLSVDEITTFDRDRLREIVACLQWRWARARLNSGELDALAQQDEIVAAQIYKEILQRTSRPR